MAPGHVLWPPLILPFLLKGMVLKVEIDKPTKE
jgi:hypothetical protein